MAVSFSVVMVAQRNPARGAMAFAVSVLATCGLFLLLAAPFLMAATVVVYAGATIVTFLFVLMLSHAGGPSDENDRTREPLLGSLGGLGFAGLVLFTLYLGSPARATEAYPLPAAPVTADEQQTLRSAAADLSTAAGWPTPGGWTWTPASPWPPSAGWWATGPGYKNGCGGWPVRRPPTRPPQPTPCG